MGVDHPDYAPEKKHLDQTLAIIARETALLSERIDDQKAALADLRKVVMDEYAELILRELIHKATLRMLGELRLASHRAYFTRIDFLPGVTDMDGSGDVPRETYYIGKYGVFRSDILEAAVVDWRSPVANLYYSGQVGIVRYEAPDGAIEGRMTLKRMIDARDGDIVSIFDTDVATRDAHLQSVLGSVSGNRLREIVTTIQTEQNNIIRHDPASHLIVQGVAGSGKTTIALHRIAYLLYVKRESIAASQLMILAPNPLFLDYISAVLPDLGVEEVVQTTFEGLAQRLTDGRLPAAVPDRTLDDIAQDPGVYALASALGSTRGSAAFFHHVLAWLEAWEPGVIPDGDVRFGPVVLWTAEQLRTVFLNDLRFFSLERRIAEMTKSLKHRTAQALLEVQQRIMNDCEKRAAHLRILAIPEAEKRARMQTLYNSRDGRLKEAKDAVAPFLKEQRARWPKLNPLEAYRSLWETLNPAEFDDPAAWAAARAHVLQQLEKKRVTQGDLAPLILVARKLCGLKNLDLRTIIVDEAQDASVFQLMLLRLLFRAPITLVGDLAQGIHAYAGLADWHAAQRALGWNEPEKPAAPILTLRTSYRSTVEIIEAANGVTLRHAVPGQTAALPVLRSGPVPDWRQVEEKQRPAAIARSIEAWLDEGFRSMCIIEKTRARADKLAKALNACLREGASARLLLPESKDYQAGLWVASATDIKGLEFDCVLLADAGGALWPDNALTARLLYVAMTRPLHRLRGVYTGGISALLTATDRPDR